MTGQANGTADGGSDIFLHVDGRGGAIRGEVTTEGHVDDIAVRGWQWGVSASSGLGSGRATARRAYRHLVVSKCIDSASTPLVASLATNAELREVVLTMRKSGGEVVDYFRMVLGNARVVDVGVDVDAAGIATERVSLAYQRITLTYTPQQGAGGGGGNTEFEDEVFTPE